MEQIEVSFCIAYSQLFSILQALLTTPYHVAIGTVGLNVSPSRSKLELIPRTHSIVHEGEVAGMGAGGGMPVSPQGRPQPTFILSFTPYRVIRPHAYEALALTLTGSRRRDEMTCHILLGSPPEETGAFVGALVAQRDVILPVRSMKIVGAGMRDLLAVDFSDDEDEDAVLLADTNQRQERWSRTIGALGDENWRRLVSLKFCVIGVGRSGSLISTSLAKLGVRRLSLVDPDVIDLHNLDSMDAVGEGDMGKFKAEAVAGNLARGFPSISIASLLQSAATPEGVRWMKEADLLISCVDDDFARLVVGAIACLYAKPLLDVGTGIFRRGGNGSDSKGLEMGADIRFILPGEGCIACWGGVADERRVMAFLVGGGQESAIPRGDWRLERAGSLRSLNQVAVHLGVGMIENLITGRLPQSRWLRVEFDPQGVPAIRSLDPQRIPNCPLCNLMGLGDLFVSGDLKVA